MTGKKFDDEEFISEFNNQDLSKTLDTYKENDSKIIYNYLLNIKSLLEKESKTK